METTQTAKNIQRLKNRLKVLSDQLCSGVLTWSQYQKMAIGAFVEINGDS